MKPLEKLIALEKEASQLGFNWEKPEQIIAQIQSECEEIKVHLHDKDKNKLQEEIGDLLHAAFSLCIFCELDPYTTLQSSVDKFARRFQRVKQLAKEQGLTELKGLSFDELIKIWNSAKELEK